MYEPAEGPLNSSSNSFTMNVVVTHNIIRTHNTMNYEPYAHRYTAKYLERLNNGQRSRPLWLRITIPPSQRPYPLHMHTIRPPVNTPPPTPQTP